ncbi:hypothetical protein ACLB9X_24885 [Streptomyces sp. 5K101]|uniref:hypothetical protein n=1 Tax=Streptomyces sp. 5K101 TaxID=3390037 RepID=UPI0039759C96
MLSATVLAAYMFWGWESAFSVVEENAEARSSGRAGLIAIVVTLVLFLVGATGFLHALTPGSSPTRSPGSPNSPAPSTEPAARSPPPPRCSPPPSPACSPR